MVLEVEAGIQMDSQPANILGWFDKHAIDVHAYCRLPSSAGELDDLRFRDIEGDSVVPCPIKKMVNLGLCCGCRFDDCGAKAKDSNVFGVAKPQIRISTVHWFGHIQEEK